MQQCKLINAKYTGLSILLCIAALVLLTDAGIMGGPID